MDPSQPIAAALDALLEQMIRQQRQKVLAHARELVPQLTADDVLNPDDHAALANDGRFNYEDGILAGLLSGQMALRAHFAAQRPAATDIEQS